MIKANRPDKYKDRGAVEHSGTVGMVPIREVVVSRPETGTDGGSL